MDPRERQVIDDLFGKLKQVEQQAPQRDREAEQYIQQQVTSQASAPYYMAQAMLVQERALNGLQQRVQELERQLAERPAGGGGFLAGLFGGGQPAAPAAPPPGRPMAPQAQPYAGAAYQQPGAIAPGMAAAPYGSPWARPAGGGFLAGAMQTALGVAGGMLVADAISSAFSSGTAAAEEIAHQAHGGVADAVAETPFLAEEVVPEPMVQDAGYQEDYGDNGMDEDYEEI